MENQFFRCTQRGITQRRVITLGPIFIKMVLNRAQGLKKKSQEVSARKNNNQQRYNKKCRRGGGGFRPPPGSFRVKSDQGNRNIVKFKRCNRAITPTQSSSKQATLLTICVPSLSLIKTSSSLVF